MPLSLARSLAHPPTGLPAPCSMLHAPCSHSRQSPRPTPDLQTLPAWPPPPSPPTHRVDAISHAHASCGSVGELRTRRHAAQDREQPSINPGYPSPWATAGEDQPPCSLHRIRNAEIAELHRRQASLASTASYGVASRHLHPWSQSWQLGRHCAHGNPYETGQTHPVNDKSNPPKTIPVDQLPLHPLPETRVSTACPRPRLFV